MLQKRVNAYFAENKITRQANAEMVIKSIVLLCSYVIPFLLILFFKLDTWALLLAFAVMGFGLAGIGMSIMHDANHGSYSKKKNVNNWMGYTLNLVGGMVYNWKLQHNVLHHTYTNIKDADDDIDNKLIMILSPGCKGIKKHHRFQYIYAFFFYMLITLYWVVGKDFVQHIQYRRNGVNLSKPGAYSISFWKNVLLKFFYFGYMFALPMYVQGYHFLPLLSGFLLMHAIGGFILTVIFQLAHSVEGTSFPVPDDKNIVANDWAIHQLNTTVNFSSGNKFISWYVGGLNYQVEHHLFPNICHVHYPKISCIVKQTAEEYGVPYLYSPTFMGALRSHVKMLKKFGYDFNPDLAKI
ncbi:MAG: fatty acid desaturase family protein [Bacteroidia bacterium]